jgi:hypothetical protein
LIDDRFIFHGVSNVSHHDGAEQAVADEPHFGAACRATIGQGSEKFPRGERWNFFEASMLQSYTRPGKRNGPFSSMPWTLQNGSTRVALKARSLKISGF